MADHPRRERDMKLPAVEVKGRWFTKYDPQIALEIVEKIADGELLNRITAKDAVPLTITKQTFLRWVTTVPELAEAYSAALQISAHSFEEMAIDKAQRTADAPGSPANVSAAGLLISQYRWSAARRNPTRYSDKGNTQIVVPVQINTSLDMGNGQSKTTVEVPDIYTINVEDAHFEEVTNPPGELVSREEPTRQDISALFKEMIQPEEKVIGTQRQPIYGMKPPNQPPHPTGPRKRVLTPRIKK